MSVGVRKSDVVDYFVIYEVRDVKMLIPFSLF